MVSAGLSFGENVMPPEFYDRVRSILEGARSNAMRAVNFAMVEAYWEIGRSIVEQQGGTERAEYGDHLIAELSQKLSHDYGRGFTMRNLRAMRQFYLLFPIRHALRAELSWSHYRLLIRVNDPEARQFYIDECVKSAWSTRKLEHQISSQFYERLLMSSDKEAVRAEYRDPEPSRSPSDIVRDPYVLDFLGIGAPSRFTESDLEQALIDHLQEFMLELGRGFAFVARQQRIVIGGDNFYVDLVFYNYLARCFVLIDLKAGKLSHQDLGQMQMYVNYYTRELMVTGDEAPIGIVLCADKNEAVVRYTLPEGESQISASRYRLHMPDESVLQREIEAERRAIESVGVDGVA